MKPDAIAVLLGCLGYTVGLALFSIGGEQLPTAAYGVAFVGMLLLGGITLLTTRALRRDLQELGGESA
jgi:hypothetical protein